VYVPGDEMPLLIEMVVDLGVNRAELLQRLRTSKPLHRPLSSSKRLVRILRPIVETATDLVPIGGADLFHRRGIRTKPVSDDLPRLAVLLHDPLEQLQRRGFVPLRRNHRLQDLAFMVNGAPEIAELAIDLHKRSSGPGEFHPQALTDPDMSVSAHPAPTVRPLPDTAIANVRTALAPDALRPGPSAAHADDALSGVDISTSPSVPGADRDALTLGKVPICDTGHSS